METSRLNDEEHASCLDIDGGGAPILVTSRVAPRRAKAEANDVGSDRSLHRVGPRSLPRLTPSPGRRGPGSLLPMKVGRWCAR
jgi:hypothetical protein